MPQTTTEPRTAYFGRDMMNALELLDAREVTVHRHAVCVDFGGGAAATFRVTIASEPGERYVVTVDDNQSVKCKGWTRVLRTLGLDSK